jgi:uncharacterized protein YdeI (YjbR/CyaY-like superfamily)
MPKAVRSKSTASIQHFEAPLERLPSRLQWTIVYIGFDAGKVWGLRGQIKVKGAINGFAFRSSLFPTRQGRHFLLINKGMQRGAGVAEGNVARLVIELDREERTVDPPIQLARILRQDRSLRRWYDKLNYSTRNDMANWISEPKSDEVRERRADQIAERLMAVMDAERELPPILQLAFARQPKARQGWEMMSRSRRRGHLFGIFYYRAPGAQGRHTEKMLDDACAIAEKKATKG